MSLLIGVEEAGAMAYADLEQRMRGGDLIVLDGGTGTELERRGVKMDPDAWCGPATLSNIATLEEIHADYMRAGADVVTANTYATSRMMLKQAGIAHEFERINRTAIAAAGRARELSGRANVAIAGSLSHMIPRPNRELFVDFVVPPSEAELADAYSELAHFIRDAGCDLLMVEMMYHPYRMAPAFAAGAGCGLPMWAGFAARRNENGDVVSFAKDADIPFKDVVSILKSYDVAAAGIMHTPSDVVADAVAILRDVYDGPLLAYPDSGYFRMPHWNFEDVITPDDLAQFARDWMTQGVRIIGGCCGLGPAHIAAIAALR
ncbi:MAG: homocysteine S-methyltransferase family protein [Hyphomicrobiaceae bacterium]